MGLAVSRLRLELGAAVAAADMSRDMTLARIPTGRWTSPEEAASPICFPLSNAASFITGQTASVDGGAFMSP
jgi:3-oxoacyl-[acyl-carrier protein] reductase